MAGINDVNSMVSGLQTSIDAALKRVKSQTPQSSSNQASSSANVQSYQQDTRKSGYNFVPFATHIGVLVKDTSRLNVMSSLAGGDTADFYKVQVATDGNMGLGQVGDSGVRFQLMDKTGNVLADSDPDSGTAYDAYNKLKSGEYAGTKGDYTVRISRAKGENPQLAKDYALQFTQGSFTKDYDTIARQPDSTSGQATSYLDVLRGSDGSTNGLLPGSGALASINSNSALSILGGSATSTGSLVNMLL